MMADPENGASASAAPATTASPLLPRLGQHLRRTAYVVYVVLADTYGVLVTALLLIKWFIGEQWHGIGLFNSLFPVILLPALITLPVSLWIRRWRMAIFAIPPLLVFFIQYGIFFIPRSPTLAADVPQLTVLTYNTHAERFRLEPMVELIQEADADIVALQEFTQTAADTFAAELAEDYPYQALYPIGGTVLGKGILSRYPLHNAALWPDATQANHLRVEVDWHDMTLVFYNAHPTVPRWIPPFNAQKRGWDIEQVLERTTQETDPLILVGDFNSSDQSDDYQQIAAHYTDTFREVGSGLGFSFPDYSRFMSVFRFLPPIVRLDYVWHDANWQGVEAYVWSHAGGSDHRPVLARLALVGTAN